MNDTMNQRLSRIVSDLNDLKPRFVVAIERFDERGRTVGEAKKVGELEQCAEFWVAAAYRNALIRLRLILENNFLYLETLNVLATTRYVFETLVWLRLIYIDPDYGLVFYGKSISDQLKHFKDLKIKLEGDIKLFETLHKEESVLQENSLNELIKNMQNVNSDQVEAATASIMDEIDRKARRAFSLYAEEAKQNGFGFQAHLIGQQIIPQVNVKISELEVVQKEFYATCTVLVSQKIKEYWKWKEKAQIVKMGAQYDFIYNYTSRLLHASASSIFTDQKNLEASEMVMFLDYVYVSMLDVLDLAKKQLDQVSS